MYAINDAKMFYDMADGQAIVINFETGMYYGMSLLGSAVLDLLLKGAEVKDMAEALKSEAGCPETMEEEIRAFIADLLAKEIIVENDLPASGTVEVAFNNTALSEGFELEANEFAEAQDLILADPIHDVDVNMGWPIMKEGM